MILAEIDIGSIPNKYRHDIQQQRYKEDVEGFMSYYPVGAAS